MVRSLVRIGAAVAIAATTSWAGSASAQRVGSSLGSTSYQGPVTSGWGQQVSADAARLRTARQLATLINEGKCDDAIKRVSVTEDTVMIKRVRDICAPPKTKTAAN
jgi:hypothetical protein